LPSVGVITVLPASELAIYGDVASVVVSDFGEGEAVGRLADVRVFYRSEDESILVALLTLIPIAETVVIVSNEVALLAVVSSIARNPG
jgi:hypothetical protein